MQLPHIQGTFASDMELPYNLENLYDDELLEMLDMCGFCFFLRQEERTLEVWNSYG